MSTALAAAEAAPISNILQPFQLLDTYSDTGTVDAVARIDAIATISAGEKGPNNVPTRTKDGRIVLHDPGFRAAGLAQILAENNYKFLDIAFPFNDLNLIIQQRFTDYSRTALLAYGDAESITLLSPDQGRRVVYAGTPEYAMAIKRPGMKVSVSVYFQLARWTDKGPEIYFPDGMGFYRLRFTSRNSLRSIYQSLQTTAIFCRGQIAGLPFRLRIDERDVAGSTGERRKVGVFTCVFSPPQTISMQLTSGNFAEMASKALAQGAALMLAPPKPETWEVAAVEGPDTDLDDIEQAKVDAIVQGGLCDAEHWRKHYFAVVKDSPYDNDKARADIILNYTQAKGLPGTDSLPAFLSGANEEQANDLIMSVTDQVQFELDEAKSAYGRMLDHAETLGIRRRELPADAKWSEVKLFTESLNTAIQRRQDAAKAAPAPGTLVEGATVIDPATVPDSYAVAESLPANAPPLNSVAAAVPSTASGELPVIEGEVSESVAAPTPAPSPAPAPPAPAAAPPASEEEDPFAAGPYSESVRLLLDKAAAAGFVHNMDSANPALVAAVNAWLSGVKSKHKPAFVRDLREIPEEQVAVFVGAFVNGHIQSSTA